MRSILSYWLKSSVRSKRVAGACVRVSAECASVSEVPPRKRCKMYVSILGGSEQHTIIPSAKDPYASSVMVVLP